MEKLSRMSLSAMPHSVSINGNMETVPTNLIEQLKSEIDGQVIDRSRVVDHLLDLRLLAKDDSFTSAIDEVLADVPGLSMVETSWWESTLVRFAQLAERLPA